VYTSPFNSPSRARCFFTYADTTSHGRLQITHGEGLRAPISQMSSFRRSIPSFRALTASPEVVPTSCQYLLPHQRASAPCTHREVIASQTWEKHFVDECHKQDPESDITF
jgi:hypothetical protein